MSQPTHQQMFAPANRYSQFLREDMTVGQAMDQIDMVDRMNMYLQSDNDTIQAAPYSIQHASHLDRPYNHQSYMFNLY